MSYARHIGRVMKATHFLPMVLAAASATITSPALAKDDTQLWTSATINAKLTDKLKFSNELVLRFSDSRSGLYEIENSSLLGYQVNDTVSVWAGYVHNPNYLDGDLTAMERRAREQVVFDNIASIGKAKIGARLRMEQRWRDHVDGTGWRMRPYVKLAVPLGGKKAPTLNLSHEEFINLNTTSFQADDGFDRMRNAVSLSIPLNTSLKAEAGYLNQYRFVLGGPDVMDHVLTAAVSLAL